MKLIVGLGNPEADYSKTRHNMGFNVINSLAAMYDIDISRNKFEAEFGSGIIENEKVILIKPQTFMNLSGKSVIQFINFYKISLDDLIVIYDDMDIDISKIRIRKSGSPGSHNGMKSIVNILANDKFIRVRVGIGKPKYDEDIINYVIGAIPEEEIQPLREGVEKAKEAVIEILKNNIDSAMNKFN
ncbi:MAG: aminoacyl-tRNA hydrolase [Clostridia bacterium]|nr:aminoacyl-tRNA hydrolase [Clostridia bacterium]